MKVEDSYSYTETRRWNIEIWDVTVTEHKTKFYSNETNGGRCSDSLLVKYSGFYDSVTLQLCSFKKKMEEPPSNACGVAVLFYSTAVTEIESLSASH